MFIQTISAQATKVSLLTNLKQYLCQDHEDCRVWWQSYFFPVILKFFDTHGNTRAVGRTVFARVWIPPVVSCTHQAFVLYSVIFGLQLYNSYARFWSSWMNVSIFTLITGCVNQCNTESFWTGYSYRTLIDLRWCSASLSMSHCFS